MGDVILTDLVKSYSDVTAVQDMNLSIEDGEFVTFVGPSGCGKSTTLEMIAGLTEPSGGTIEIGGLEVTTLPPKDRDIAMVFQNIALFPHLDVHENVSFGLSIQNHDTDYIDDRVEEALEIVELSGMNDRMPDELSGGQRQRVAIARAIVRDPAVFLMDEPLANLDAKLRVHMRTELQRLHDVLETTVIYVTHDQAEAMTMSDRIAVLNDGRLQQFAPPLTCYNEPANRFVAGFIGSPSMNLFEGELAGAEVSTEQFSVEVETGTAVEDGSDVVFGIRPEDVYLAADAQSATDASSPIDTVTDVIEPMGNEVFVYLEFDGADAGSVTGAESAQETNQLLMSVDPDTEIPQGESVSVVVDRAKAHLFDGASGEALRHGLDSTD